MIKLENITKTYNHSFVAVDDISMHIKPGSIVGFVGPNGAGKTTTLNMITGILRQDTGNIFVYGFDTLKERLNSKKHFGYVPDNPNSFLKLKGIEYLNFIADIYDIEELKRKENIQKYAKLFSMESSLNDKISSYSHGMRQKIMLMGALIHEPQVLILDEPLTGLDPHASFLLKELMKDLKNDNKSILFSTHILEVAEKLCDEIIIINNGRIIYTGTLENLKEQHDELSLEEIFLEVTRT